jgi:hypothetical protein
MDWLTNSSFPTTSSFVPPKPAEDSSSDSDSEVVEKRKKKKKEKKGKKEKKSKKSKKSKRAKTDKEKIVEIERQFAREDTRKGSDNLSTDGKSIFFFDTKGDQDNLIFGSLYKNDIPDYDKHR